MGAACSRFDGIHQDDIIIPVVGRRGVGKSTFINTAVGRDVVPIDHALEGISYVKCSSPECDGRNIVFVEITLSELDLSRDRVVEELNHWLTELSLRGLKLPGILYLHRIADVEPISAFNHLTSLRSQEELNRLLPAAQLTIVATMWGVSQPSPIGVEWDKELEEYVTGLATPQRDYVPRIMRFANTFESAWLIVHACVEDTDRLQLRPGRYERPSFSAARTLISRIVEDTLQKARIAELVGEDAQCMADFLNIVLHENGILESDEGKYLLRLLRKLAKSAQVFPRCYKLDGVQCDFSQPREGGGFADIFRGEYENQVICIKAVRIFQEQDNAQMLRAHVKELILWAHLSHQNILPFYGAFLFGKEPQRLCIVSPWMDNGDLSIFLKNFPQTPRMPLISGIIAGLRYLHRSNIVHGDLKAKNVLVSDDGRALITDFGISRIVMTTRLASTRLSNGTMRWTAPELLAGDGDDFLPPTPESDVWSFSCLCYEIFTCKVPFHQYSNDYRLLFALLRDKEIPVRPITGDQFNGIDDCMWNLMERCWDYVPSNRPACEEIQQCVVGMGTPDDQSRIPLRPSGTSTFWEDIKNKSEITINYERVHQILLGACSSTRMTGSTAPQDLFIAMGTLDGSGYRPTSLYNTQSPLESHEAVRETPLLWYADGKVVTQQVPPKFNMPYGDDGSGESQLDIVPATSISGGISVTDSVLFQPMLGALSEDSIPSLRSQQRFVVDQQSTTEQSSNLAPEQEFTFSSQTPHGHDITTASNDTSAISSPYVGQRQLGNAVVDEQIVNPNDILPGTQLNSSFNLGQGPSNSIILLDSNRFRRAKSDSYRRSLTRYEDNRGAIPLGQLFYVPRPGDFLDQQIYNSSTWSPDGPPPSIDSVHAERPLVPSPEHIRRAPSGEQGAETPSGVVPGTADARHKRRKQEASFICPIPGCGSTFTRSFNLKGHIRSHKEEDSFVCHWPGCGKGFARQHDCKQHEQLHTNVLNRHLRSGGGAECLKLQEANGSVNQSENGGVESEKAEVGNVGSGGVTKVEEEAAGATLWQ